MKRSWQKFPTLVTRALRAILLHAAPNASLARKIRDAVLLKAASVKSLKREGSVVIQPVDGATGSAAFHGVPGKDEGRTSLADGGSGAATGVVSGSAEFFALAESAAGPSAGAATFIGATNVIGAGASMGSTSSALAAPHSPQQAL